MPSDKPTQKKKAGAKKVAGKKKNDVPGSPSVVMLFSKLIEEINNLGKPQTNGSDLQEMTWSPTCRSEAFSIKIVRCLCLTGQRIAG